MSRFLRLLALLAVLAGQLGVAGQALALPDCHGASSGTMAHAAMGHAAQAEDTDDEAADCHCPQGMHCGHCTASLASMGHQQARPSIIDDPGQHNAANTTLGHRVRLERPPSSRY